MLRMRSYLRHPTKEAATASDAFGHLRDFLLDTMRIQHVYQPVMLKTLLQNGGRATTREIAAAFLALDQSQLDYYEIVTKRMPGNVLRRHGIVEYERRDDAFHLASSNAELSASEAAELVAICESRLREFLKKRGETLYSHRSTALGDLSGTVRYQVLSRAGFRCELCGVPADERALHVDHIVPRKHGGKDVIENLQALCWLCNGNKGDRDATDFRAVREALCARQEDCVFCKLPIDALVATNTLAVGFRAKFPVSRYHSLVIPRRHAETWFDLFEPERKAIDLLLDELRGLISEQDATVTGFNIGMNCGRDAGQTVDHAHVHLIPRRHGEVLQPLGDAFNLVPRHAQ